MTRPAADVRADGIAAPLVLGGAINGESFLAYVRQFLAPALRPGDVLVMDNLPSHKVAGSRSYRLAGREVGLSKNTVAAIVRRARPAVPTP